MPREADAVSATDAPARAMIVASASDDLSSLVISSFLRRSLRIAAPARRCLVRFSGGDFQTSVTARGLAGLCRPGCALNKPQRRLRATLVLTNPTSARIPPRCRPSALDDNGH